MSGLVTGVVRYRRRGRGPYGGPGRAVAARRGGRLVDGLEGSGGLGHRGGGGVHDGVEPFERRADRGGRRQPRLSAGRAAANLSAGLIVDRGADQPDGVSEDHTPNHCSAPHASNRSSSVNPSFAARRIELALAVWV